MLMQFVRRFLDGTPSETQAVATDNPLPVQMVGTPADNPAIGTPTDTAAPADGAGNYGIVAALKRSLLNGAAMLGRMPELLWGRVPVAVLLRPFGDATVMNVTTSVQNSAALPAGTVAVRIQKSSGVSVRFRLAASGSTWNNATTTGQVMLDDVVGFVDIPLAAGTNPTTTVVQMVRADGNTGTGQFAFTPLIGA